MRLSREQSVAVVLCAISVLGAVGVAQANASALSSSESGWALEEPERAERSGRSGSPAADGPEQRKMAAHAVRFAQAQVGKPYVAGYRGPQAYDCSGLTWAAYADAGLSWPMSMALSYQQWNPRAYGISTLWTVQVPPDEVRPGDLVFFDWYANASDAPRGLTGPAGVDHVGIVEDPRAGTMIEAANPGVGVIRSSYVSGGNAAHLIGFARVLYRK